MTQRSPDKPAFRIQQPIYPLRHSLPVLMLALSTSLMADDSVKLNDVVVTAAGYEQEMQNAPASISVITREDLENHAYRDLTDALRDVPGVVITGGGGGDRGTDISMRGMPANYSVLLVDGKKISSRESRPNGSAGFETDWLPPLATIERIEVVRGPMSTLYGSDAIGGVVNIITRKVPDQWSGNIQQDLAIQEDSKSGNYFQTTFNAGGPLIDNLLGLQVYGEVYNREEDEILYGYEDKSLQSLTSRLSLTPTENHDFTLEVGVTSQRRQAHMGMSAPSTGCRGGCTDSDTEHLDKRFALSHSGRWDIGTSETYIQRESTKNRGRDIEIITTTANTSVVMPLGDHMLTVGAYFEDEELNDNTTNRISNRTNISNSQWAVFAENEWWLTDSFALTAGTRLDNNENFGNHVSPRLYGVWSFAPQWTLKGGVSAGYRSPDLREITPDWGQVSRGGNIYGNPNLQPETSVNREIGLHFSDNQGLSTSVTLFDTDFKDKITRIQCPISICTAGPNMFGADPTYRVNVDEATTQGVEASLKALLTDSLDVSLSYTYTDSEQQSGEYKGEPLTQLPEHLFSAGLDWQATRALSPWLRVTYRGEESQPNTGPSQSAIIAPSNTLVDMGLGYQLTQRATIKAGVYNLLDKEIGYDEYGYIEDGRKYWLAMNLAF